MSGREDGTDTPSVDPGWGGTGSTVMWSGWVPEEAVLMTVSAGLVLFDFHHGKRGVSL